MTESKNDTFSKFTKRFAIISKFDMFSGKRDRIIGITKSEESAKALVEEMKRIESIFSTVEITPIFWEE